MTNPWESESARRWEEWRLNQEAAYRAHDAYHSNQTEMFKSVIAFGVEAIRTSALINGGATVASIALVGSVFQHDQALATALALAILLFAAGVIGAGLASGFSYLAQFFYERQLDQCKLTFEHPYLDDRNASRWNGRVGGSFHLAAIACVMLSYVALAGGVWAVWFTLRSAV